MELVFLVSCWKFVEYQGSNPIGLVRYLCSAVAHTSSSHDLGMLELGVSVTWHSSPTHRGGSGMGESE